ncbi:MAG TPA: hypothetical protein VFH73_24140 [Polyangia bacterium]|jgi:hypothetical protein|nr:hypothetical protein [Polyangia bacterium]
MKTGLAAMAAATATALLLSVPAHGYTYTGPIVARTSGVTCRATDAADSGNTIIRSSAGVQPWGSDQTLFCPIIRRNASPQGQFTGALGGDTVVNLSVLDVYIQQQNPVSFSCRAFGTIQETGSQIVSAPRFTCSTNLNGGCTSAGTPFTGSPSLHFTNPFGRIINTEGMVNIGFKCTVPSRQFIIGSVAQFPTW